MTPRRVLFGTIAIVAALAAFFLGTQDVHYEDRNCGTAVLRTDPTKFSFDTGDTAADEFADDSALSSCNQLILRQRFLTLLPVALGAIFLVVGRQLRKKADLDDPALYRLR